jgi:predicted  nucleic acid-binding Zn-ribbon protein
VIVEDTPTVNSSEKIEKLQKEADEHRAAIEKIKQEKSKLFTNREEIDWKIECIREDIASFISHIKEIAVQ